MSQTASGNIAINVIPPYAGGWVCQATSSPAGRDGQTTSFHGQTSSHAIALALEDLARAFRMKAEAEQNIDPEAVDRLAAGEAIDKRFHVILHYERVVDEESKFDAMTNTLHGNTVIENAEISIIQVDPGLPQTSLLRTNSPVSHSEATE